MLKNIQRSFLNFVMFLFFTVKSRTLNVSFLIGTNRYHAVGRFCFTIHVQNSYFTYLIQSTHKFLTKK